MIVSRKLPNGHVPTEGIKGRAERESVARLNENVTSLAMQLEELQGVCRIMERDLKGALSKIAEIAAV